MLKYRIYTSEDIISTKESIKQHMPFYGEILDFYEKIFLLQEQVKSSFDPDHVILKDEQIENLPLVHPSEFIIDMEASCKLLHKIIQISREENHVLQEYAVKFEKYVNKEKINPEILIKYILNGEKKEFSKAAEDIQISYDTLYFFIYNSIKPFIYISSQQLAHYLKDNDNYNNGQCPVCGGNPSLSVFNENGERTFICEFCCNEWQSKRMYCPYCNNSETKKLKYVYSETELFHRAYLCDECNKYIKTVDLRNLGRSFYPPFEILSSLHLDLKAMELGYCHGLDNAVYI